MSGYEGKVALITGGTGAAGSAVTDLFLAEGGTVVLVWHRTPPPERERLIAIQGDTSRTDAMTKVVTDALSQAGQIDLLVNLVGGFAGGRVVDTTDDTWNRMLSVNLTSAFIVTRAVLPHMLARRSGGIVHVGSRATVDPAPGAAAYAVAKAGLGALVRTLAGELGGTGVRVNAVLPRIIDTPENRRDNPNADVSKWLPPASLARTILWAAGPESGEMNGALIPVG